MVVRFSSDFVSLDREAVSVGLGLAALHHYSKLKHHEIKLQTPFVIRYTLPIEQSVVL